MPLEQCHGRGWWWLWGVVIVAGLCLSVWQVSLGQAQAQHDEDISRQPAFIMPVAPPASASLIELQGTWLGNDSRLVKGLVLDTHSGVAVLTPFRARDGRWWLIERGFLALPPTTSESVVTETGLESASGEGGEKAILTSGLIPVSGYTTSALPQIATPAEETVIRGRWQWLESRSDDDVAAEGAPLEQLDMSAWRALGAPAFAGVLHQVSGAGQLIPWWLPDDMTPEYHYACALQWLCLCLGAAIVMLLGLRRQRRTLLREYHA